MEILKINALQFEEIKDEIKKLIKETMIFNFPKAIISDNYYETTLANVKDYLEKETAIVYVVMNKENVQGWIWCHEIFRFNEKRIHIANFAVKPDSRELGIGNILINTVEKYASDNHYDGIDLLVTKDNIQAVSFYEKHGYEVERYIMRKEI